MQGTNKSVWHACIYTYTHARTHTAWSEYYTVCILSCTGFMDASILHSVEAQLDFSERSGVGPSAVYSKTFQSQQLNSRTRKAKRSLFVLRVSH